MHPAILLQTSAAQGWNLDLALVRMAFVLLGGAMFTLVAACGWTYLRGPR